MADFKEFWRCVEHEMKLEIPPYIKNILKYCGYENCHTISTIKEGDIEDFQNKVRKGHVTNFFDNAAVNEGPKLPIESTENFEFSRGHQKLILAVTKFVKDKLYENGVDSFSLPETRAIIRKRSMITVPSAAVSTKIAKISTDEYSPQARVVENSELYLGPLSFLEEHKSTILRKMVLSLVTLTPEKFANNYESITKERKLSDSIYVEIKSSATSEDTPIQYRADICCAYCSKPICVSHSSNGEKGKPWWNMSNFDRHLEVHQKDSLLENENELKRRRPFIQSERCPENQEEKDKYFTSPNCLSLMLKTFLDSAERNFDRQKPGYRFDLLTKMFSTYIFMLSGRLAYETLNANLPLSIPSVSTVSRFLKDSGPIVIEGKMRTDELLKYLKSRNLPSRVCISEDATRVNARVSFDPNTNQLVGFALPLDENGMPIPSSFPARSFREIHGHFTNPSNAISSSVYVQMAKPLEPNAPSFCLMMYLTDNTFTAHNTLKRWRFQAEALRAKGITIENIATDGDSRPLKAMKFLSKIGQSDRLFFDCEYYSCGGAAETTFTQDCIHVLTKARNRILKCSRIFPIGNKIISSSHLKYLIANVSKDKHLLTRTDIEPKDRQNYLSAQKICSKNTVQCLLDFVPGCEGTVMYLNAMRNVSTALMDYNIKSAERIYLIWHSVFFFRGWRSWLINSEKKDPSNKKSKRIYNLKENFISSNCYTCVELNAHALVKKILVQDTNTDDSCSDKKPRRNETFFPDLISSQPCESIFRQVRSFTSTFSTVVNFCMLDIINRIKKIQMQSDIIATLKNIIKFPRFEKKEAKVERLSEQYQFDGLNQTEIKLEIEKARIAVIEELKIFGIDTSQLNFHCQVKPVFEKDVTKDDCKDDGDIDSDGDSDEDSDSEESETSFKHFVERSKESGEFLQEEMQECFSDDEFEDLEKDIDALSCISGDLLLKNYSAVHSVNKIRLSEDSPFVVVVDKNSKEIVVRKSSVCWLFSKDKFKLSSDRLQRVQENEYSANFSESHEVIPLHGYSVRDQISIGEWCIFGQGEYESIFPQREDEELQLLVGMVLGFTYLDGNTFKQREFSKISATIPKASTQNSQRGVGVLCSLYTCNTDGSLMNVPGYKHKFITIDSYLGTITSPIYINKRLTISTQLFNAITDLV